MGPHCNQPGGAIRWVSPRQAPAGVVVVKPLSPAPLTDEDYEIWYTIDVRSSAQYPPCLRSHWADHRDAEVMLQLCHFDHWERDYTEDRLRRTPTALRLVRHQL